MNTLEPLAGAGVGGWRGGGGEGAQLGQDPFHCKFSRLLI